MVTNKKNVLLLCSLLLLGILSKLLKIDFIFYPVNSLLFIWTIIEIARAFRPQGLLEGVLFATASFFFIYTPTLFILYYFGLTLNPEILGIFNLIVTLSLLLTQHPLSPDREKIKKIIKNKSHYFPLLFGIGLFVLVHMVNYHLYHFIPESDSYFYLKKVTQLLHGLRLEEAYRGFFPLAIALVSLVTSISPYWVIIFTIIGSTVSLLFMSNIVLDYFKTTPSFKYLAFLFLVSIPVINLEIDIVRPQSIFLIGLPVYIYLCWRFLITKKYNYLLLSTAIVIAGLNYHEFFVFIFLSQVLFLSIFFVRNMIKKGLNQDRKIILSLSFLSAILTITLLSSKIRFLRFFEGTLEILLSHVTKVGEWRWWFLNNYTDALGINHTMSWNGWWRALQYYGYNAGTVLIPILIILLVVHITRKNKDSNKKWLLLTIPFFSFFLFGAEILPRINFTLMPERFWIFTSLTGLLLCLPFFKHIERYNKPYKSLLTFLIILGSTIGLGGTWYIANQKKALTTKGDVAAVDWIKENTPSDAVIVSQPANSPMITFFADRQLLVPEKDFFIDNRTLSYYPPEKLSLSLDQLRTNAIQFNEQVSNTDLTGPVIETDSINTAFSKYNSSLSSYRVIKKRTAIITPSNCCYLLYSENKFNDLRDQIVSWRQGNFYNINTEKLNSHFPTLYNKHGVTIWKLPYPKDK